jgi:hypothetical protein
MRTPGGCHRLVEHSSGFAVADRLALRCPHLGMPSPLARDVLIVLHTPCCCERRAVPKNCLVETAQHPHILQQSIKKSLHDSAAKPTCELCGRWRQRTPRGLTPARHPQNQANGLSRSLLLVGRSLAEVRPGTYGLYCTDCNRFCTASFLDLDCDATQSEYGVRRAAPSESLFSHHQPSPANRTGAKSKLAPARSHHLPNTHPPRSSLTHKTRTRTTCPHEEKSSASVSIPLTLVSTVEGYS